jgi:hypothetical protein
MYKLGLNFLLACVALFTLTNCSNDFEVIEEQKEIPVVYCLLDPDQPVQILRLEKAFASQTVSANELAKNSESFYYKNAVVKMIRTSKSGTKTFTLKEVNGATINLPRVEGGFFATNPNKVYTINTSEMALEPGDVVKLEISTGEGSTITSQTTIIAKVNSSFPRVNLPISFSDMQNDIFRWNNLSAFAGVSHTVALDFNYTETEGGNAAKKTIRWNIASNVDQESVIIGKGSFYSILAGNMQKSNNIKRFYSSIDYYIYSADKNLNDFLKVATANTGITGSGEVPTYSNLSKGLGVFASRAVLALKGLDLSVSSKNILKENVLTKDLNFQ